MSFPYITSPPTHTLAYHRFSSDHDTGSEFSNHNFMIKSKQSLISGGNSNIRCRVHHDIYKDKEKPKENNKLIKENY